MMHTSTAEFTQAYQRLNPQQRQAVDTLEGPVMVIAGPGTGKTQVLATRIANLLLKTDTQPGAVLALTFTDSAAKNMRERLVSLIGPTAYQVRVQTFHSFCEEVIQVHPEYFPLGPESEALSDLERYDILQSILLSTSLSALRTLNSPFHYIKHIIKAISDLKRERVDELKLAELVGHEQEVFESQRGDMKKTELVRRQKELAKMQELAVVYTQYQHELVKRHRYDYDDMIRFVAEALQKHTELLLEYQEKISYFFVDEYQDTNAAQNNVVDALASFWGEQANIFVVGDPHQSIYRFQGASLENTLSFMDRYPSALCIRLTIGYRCPQSLYTAAAAVIQQNLQSDDTDDLSLAPTRKFLFELGQPLQSVKSEDALVRVFQAQSEELEVLFVVEEVQRLLAEGVTADQIAILFRNNADALPFAQALEKWQVPYRADEGNDALQNLAMQQFLTLMKVVEDVRFGRESGQLFSTMSFEWLAKKMGLSPLLVMTVTRAAGKTKMSIIERIVLGYDQFSALQFCKDVTALEFAVLTSFVEQLRQWGQTAENTSFLQWFETVMSESGFYDWVVSQPNRAQVLENLAALIHEVTQLAKRDHQLSLTKFLEIIATMQEHRLKIGVTTQFVQRAAVTLSTVHKAKGQEWQHVFLVQCVDGKWGNAKTQVGLPLPEGILRFTDLSVKDRNEDDRRLFYVALTRAKQQFTITSAAEQVGGGRTKTMLSSVFVAEIPAAQKVQLGDEKLTAALSQSLPKLLLAAPPKNYAAVERSWLSEVIQEYRLSVTGLNTYLRSPKDFFHREVLKVPELRNASLAFGTAIHYAFEQLFRFVQKTHEMPPVEQVQEAFERSLRQEPLDEATLTTRLNQGKNLITQYLDQYQAEQPSLLFLEKFFGYGGTSLQLHGVHVVGRVDRIDIIDSKQKLLRIVDYKTGRAKTVNEIEGKVSLDDYSPRELALPEPIRGPYKRQLLFYKLLTQLDRSFPGTVTEGMFDFVEPVEEKFVRRNFSLLDEDVELLKELIVEVMTEIRELTFLESL